VNVMDEDLKDILYVILFFAGVIFGFYVILTLLFWGMSVTVYHSDGTLLQVIEGQYDGICKLSRQIV
jgi:hypothetical protein